jgi:hypothetical protein
MNDEDKKMIEEAKTMTAPGASWDPIGSHSRLRAMAGRLEKALVRIDELQKSNDAFALGNVQLPIPPGMIRDIPRTEEAAKSNVEVFGASPFPPSSHDLKPTRSLEELLEAFRKALAEWSIERAAARVKRP